MLTLRQVVSQNQVQGLVCHDRSKRRILPRIHPSVSQEVPKVRFWGQSIPISGSSLRSSTLTHPHVYKVVDAVLAPLRLQGIRILNYIDDWLILAQSEIEGGETSRCRPRSYETVGLRLNAKKSVLLLRFRGPLI